MTNVFDRLAAQRSSTLLQEIFTADDWPALVLAPDGVMRSPLELGKTYLVHADMTIPRMWIPPAIESIEFHLIEIVAGVSNPLLLVDGDSTPHIWGRDIGSLHFRNLSVIDVSNAGVGRGSVLFDLVGGTSLSFLVHRFSSIASFKSAGKLVDLGAASELLSIVDCDEGLTTIYTGVEVSVGLTTTQLLFSQPSGLPALKPAWCLMGELGKSQFAVGTLDNNPGDSSFCIDSTSTGSFALSGNTFETNNGFFFRPDVNLAITAMSASNKSITSFSAQAHLVLTVAAGLTGSNFSLGAVRHQFAVGDIGTHSTFSEGTYNGSKTITKIVDPFVYEVSGTAFVATDSGTITHDLATVCASTGSGFTRGQTILLGGSTPDVYSGSQTIKSVDPNENSFIIPVAFSVTGSGTIQITRVTTISDHPLSIGETQTITGTTSYNETTQILFNPSDDTFEIPVAFVANDATGTVASTSKTQKFVGINCSNNGVQADSVTVGFSEMNGNATVTTVSSSNSYQALDVAGTVTGSITERFTLTNATAGIFTYDGLKPISACISAAISATKSGASQNYRFTTSVNGAMPIFASASYGPMEVKTTKVTVPLSRTETLTTGDTIQIMIAGDGHSDNITITDFFLEVHG